MDTERSVANRSLSDGPSGCASGSTVPGWPKTCCSAGASAVRRAVTVAAAASMLTEAKRSSRIVDGIESVLD